MFALVEERLAQLPGERSSEEIAEAARAIWGGVHGICILAINQTLDTRWGTILMFVEQMKTIWVALFAVDRILGRLTTGHDLPVLACWVGIAAFSTIAGLLLHRKIRAHEVVS